MSHYENQPAVILTCFALEAQVCMHVCGSQECAGCRNWEIKSRQKARLLTDTHREVMKLTETILFFTSSSCICQVCSHSHTSRSWQISAVPDLWLHSSGNDMWLTSSNLKDMCGDIPYLPDSLKFPLRLYAINHHCYCPTIKGALFCPLGFSISCSVL